MRCSGPNVLYDTSDRVQFVSRRLGADTVIDLPFGDLLTKRLDTIRKKVEGKKLLIVRGHDIESLSVEARALQMRKLMADLLSEIRRGIRRLRDLGVSHVVLCEPNFNLVELGPRGTGKSYVFQEISPYTLLLTGPTTVANLFFNMATGKIGLVGLWDSVAFDEVADLQRKLSRPLKPTVSRERLHAVKRR
jgi:Putative ATP-dependent Lon protease